MGEVVCFSSGNLLLKTALSADCLFFIRPYFTVFFAVSKFQPCLVFMKLLWLLPGQWFAFFFGLLLVTACKKEALPLAVPVLGDSGAYVFPIVPGTPAWAKRDTGASG